jgi:hypothetical protein
VEGEAPEVLARAQLEAEQGARVTWRDDLDRIVRRLNVPGIDLLAKDLSEWELAANDDIAIVKAKLDSVFGEFKVSGRALRDAARYPTAVADLLRRDAESLRNRMRGQVLVDFLNDEWSAPANVDEQLLQRMERASLRLMAFVDKRRKEL